MEYWTIKNIELSAIFIGIGTIYHYNIYLHQKSFSFKPIIPTFHSSIIPIVSDLSGVAPAKTEAK
jgi:hypothetical protein